MGLSEQPKDLAGQTKLESSLTIENDAAVGNGGDTLKLADEVELGLHGCETPDDAIWALLVGPALVRYLEL